MRKNEKSILAVLVFLAVHISLCIFYNLIYYNTNVRLTDKNYGFSYNAVMIFFFLFSPFIYYFVGRIFSRFAEKKIYTRSLWTVFIIILVLGLISVFMPSLAQIYCNINAPSYMYYLLFSDSVTYMKVAAMIASSLIPPFFSHIGYLRKSRTNNEIKMEDLKKQQEGEVTEE